jgi:hypothetical protein
MGKIKPILKVSAAKIEPEHSMAAAATVEDRNKRLFTGIS